MGRGKDTLVLDAKREKLIAATIHEIYLKPERPTMTYLIEQVRARCAQKGLPLLDRRTIKARVDRIDRRTVAIRRKDLKGVKATKAVPGQYVASRPLEVVQIDHTEVDVFLVDEKTRETMKKRLWLTLAIDVFTRMVVGFLWISGLPTFRLHGTAYFPRRHDRHAARALPLCRPRHAF